MDNRRKNYKHLAELAFAICLLTVALIFVRKAYEQAEYVNEVVNRDLSLPRYNKYGLENDADLSYELVYEDEDFLLYGDRYVKKLHVKEAAADNFTERIEALRTCFGRDSTFLVLPVPKRIQFERDYEWSNRIYEGLVRDLAARLPVSVRLIDVRDALKADTESFLYYRLTDSWTMEGSYYGYRQGCLALGITPYDREYFTYLVNNSFAGDLSSSQEAIFEGTELEETVDRIFDTDDPFVYRKSFHFKDYELHYDKDEYMEKRPVFRHSVAGTSGIIGASLSYAHLYGYGETSLMIIGDANGKLITPYFTEHYKDIFFVNVERCEVDTVKRLVEEYGIKTFIVSQSADHLGDRSYSKTLNDFLRES